MRGECGKEKLEMVDMEYDILGSELRESGRGAMYRHGVQFLMARRQRFGVGRSKVLQPQRVCKTCV